MYSRKMKKIGMRIFEFILIFTRNNPLSIAANFLRYLPTNYVRGLGEGSNTEKLSAEFPLI